MLNFFSALQQCHLGRLETDYKVQQTKIVEMLLEEEKSIREIHETVIESLHNLEECFNKKYTAWQSSILAEFQSRKDELLNKVILND